MANNTVNQYQSSLLFARIDDDIIVSKEIEMDFEAMFKLRDYFFFKIRSIRRVNSRDKIKMERN